MFKQLASRIIFPMFVGVNSDLNALKRNQYAWSLGTAQIVIKETSEYEIAPLIWNVVLPNIKGIAHKCELAKLGGPPPLTAHIPPDRPLRIASKSLFNFLGGVRGTSFTAKHAFRHLTRTCRNVKSRKTKPSTPLQDLPKNHHGACFGRYKGPPQGPRKS